MLYTYKTGVDKYQGLIPVYQDRKNEFSDTLVITINPLIGESELNKILIKLDVEILTREKE